jgi:hypothetical protein
MAFRDQAMEEYDYLFVRATRRGEGGNAEKDYIARLRLYHINSETG